MNQTEFDSEVGQWRESAGRALRESEDSFDAVTLMRLRAIRARALAVAAEPAHRAAINWGVPLAAAAGLATWAMLPRLLVEAPAPAPAEMTAAADALDLLTDERGPEFYRDLEFYRWLEERERHA